MLITARNVATTTNVVSTVRSFFSLPEDIIWFEPPTVCRWETVAESEISEKIENKSTNDQSSTQRVIKMVSRRTEQSTVKIVDFNLLRIPPTIDINFIIQEIIVPRLPDGYTIALSEPKSRPGSTALFSLESQMAQQQRIQVDSTKDFLIATNSPRPLHPKRSLKFDVKILERNPIESNPNEHEYLFSQLLMDLDDLHDKQHPEIQKQMDEISEILSISVPDEQGFDQAEAESNTDDMFSKGDEFAWNVSRRVERVPEVIEPEDGDSNDEFDESENEE